MEIQLPALIIFWLCETTLAPYTIDIYLEQFNHPEGKLLDGGICDYDGSTCDYRFQICLDHPNGNLYEYHQCGVKGPVLLKQLKQWYRIHVDQRWQEQGNILLKVRVLDGDLLDTFEVVDEFSGSIKLIAYRNFAEAYQHSLSLTLHHSSLVLLIEVFCDVNWKGPNCNCDNLHQRYSCTDDGTKVCRKYWFGRECDVECGHHWGHYECLPNGNKKCDYGYYGEYCRKYCNPNSNRYTCAENGDKICNKNWCTKNCNVICRESTTTRINHGSISEITGRITPGIIRRTTRRITHGVTPGISTRIVSGITHRTSSVITHGTTTGITPLFTVATTPGISHGMMKGTTTAAAVPGNLIPIIGGVAGLMLLVTIIGLLIFCFKRRQRGRNAQTVSMPMQSVSAGHNRTDTPHAEMNRSENLYDDAAAVGSLYEDAVAVVPMYDDYEDDATAGTSNDVYAVPDKKRKKQKGHKHDDMIDSDDMVIMENDVYDSAAEVQQQRAYKSGAAANITDDVLIVDNELYG